MRPLHVARAWRATLSPSATWAVRLVGGTIPDADQPETLAVDGGAVLLVRPYSTEQWSEFRQAWWWHTVGMLLLLPWYALVALTVWQMPSQQTLLRRVAWASMLTLGAIALVGIPPFVVFSRRWYWIWRSNVAPADVGVPAVRPDPSLGAYWIAAHGADLADRLGQRQLAAASRHTLSRRNQNNWEAAARQASFTEPWAPLVAEAGSARDRISLAASRSMGPAAVRIHAAHREAASAADLAWTLAEQVSSISLAVAAAPTSLATERLAELDASASRSSDVEATRTSLREQLATVERMELRVRDLQESLRRLVTQLGEAAIKAEELSVGASAPNARTPGLTDAVDGLTSIRVAIESVESDH